MRTLPLLALVCLACTPPAPGTGLPEDVQRALDRLPDAQVLALGPDGLPSFVHGDLGQVSGTLAGGKADGVLLPGLRSVAPLFRLADADVVLAGLETEGTGFSHARYAQRKNGLDVVGGDLTLHVNARGTLYAVHGTARNGLEVQADPALDEAAAQQAVRAAGGQDPGPGRLVYKIDERTGAMHLAWELDAGAGLAAERFWVEAQQGAVVGRAALASGALVRRIHDAKEGEPEGPGALVLEEGGPAVADPAVTAAYENLGIAWDCYAQALGRDSYDGQGSPLVATVHYGRSYSNAFWSFDTKRMTFGDGDGTDFGSIVLALDVVVHELTHGVVQHTAGLVYANDSGAINEGLADIAGAYCESRHRGVTDEDTWKIGEVVTTPGVEGDALRYLDDPARNEDSVDYWPERSSAWYDHGGVHYNATISGLAFKLLVTGGVHPRGKTDVRVPALGMEPAIRVFYRALEQYMTTQTDFAGGRAATVRAALDLYGADAAAQVHLAWDAVGVPRVDQDEAAPQEACANGLDDDHNGYADCADPACAVYGACVVQVPEGALVFSEVLARPLYGQPEGEWVELYNASSAPFDLAGFTLGTQADPGRGHRIASPVVVPAGGFVTLAYAAGDGLGFAPDYRHGDWDLRLADDGGALWLLDRQGREVARLEPGAPGFPRAPAGVSVELDGPSTDGWRQARRWRPSEAPAFNAAGDRGTPGAPNLGTTARLPAKGELIITELHADPLGPEPQSEWFEVASLAWQPVDLAGVSLMSAAGSGSELGFTGPAEVPPLGRVVLCGGAGPEGCVVYQGLTLANGGDVITLLDGADGVLDSVDWRTEGWPAPREGVSLERSENHLTPGSTQAAQWCLAVAPWEGGLATPGAVNDCRL